MRRILCVIDLTQSSQNVLDVAAGLATKKEAYLTVIFPYRLIEYGYVGDMTKLKFKLEQNAREKFSVMKNQIKSLDHLSYEFQPEIGFIVDRINFYMERNTIDMIVISKLQANGINEISSLRLKHLITNSKIPFTIVPEIYLQKNENK